MFAATGVLACLQALLLASAASAAAWANPQQQLYCSNRQAALCPDSHAAASTLTPTTLQCAREPHALAEHKKPCRQVTARGSIHQDVPLGRALLPETQLNILTL
jgi:hypothetical protein